MFLYKVIGKGTDSLSKMKAGEELEVLGPLGHGYDISAAKGKKPVFVAGGTGIASLSFLAERLKSKGTIFYGAKTRKEVVGLEKFRKLGWKTVISTDDGTIGVKGFVTDSCSKDLSAKDCKSNILFCCGPHAMMKKIKGIAEENSIEAYASLEEVMACGTGICQGCVVKIAGEYKRVCSDGPVFNLRDV